MIASKISVTGHWRALVLLLSGPVLALACAISSVACNLTTEAAKLVTKVTGPGSFMLDDGSEVVLVGALPPQPAATPETGTSSGAAPSEQWPPAEATRKALETLIAGKAVELAYAGFRLDRYGRHLAHVFLAAPHDSHTWVQGALVGQGWARAYTLPGSTACIGELTAAEAAARAAKAGHWGTGIFSQIEAHDTRLLVRYRETFQLVTGRIDHIVRFKGQTIFDLTPAGKAGMSAWLSAAARRQARRSDVDALEGKRVRVRGWIEVPDGPGRATPRITINSLREIEVLDDPTGESAPPSSP